MRDVPCVRRRARDRSIGRVRSEGPEILWWLGRFRDFVLLLLPTLASAELPLSTFALFSIFRGACPDPRVNGHVILQLFVTRLMEYYQFLE